MFTLLVLFLGLNQIGSAQNHYVDFDFESIITDLNQKIEESYYDLLILEVVVSVNTKYVEDAVDKEIERFIGKENSTCVSSLSDFKEESDEDCRMEEDISVLTQIGRKFTKLKEVACLTEEICLELNPLESQSVGLEQCQVSKFADLRQLSVTISGEFDFLKNQILEKHDKCIRDLMGTRFSQLAQILVSCK